MVFFTIFVIKLCTHLQVYTIQPIYNCLKKLLISLIIMENSNQTTIYSIQVVSQVQEKTVMIQYQGRQRRKLWENPRREGQRILISQNNFYGVLFWRLGSNPALRQVFLGSIYFCNFYLFDACPNFLYKGTLNLHCI